MQEKQFVRGFAGIVITVGFIGGWFFSDFIYLIVLFAGLNLIQSSLTGICPPEIFHRKYLRD